MDGLPVTGLPVGSRTAHRALDGTGGVITKIDQTAHDRNSEFLWKCYCMLSALFIFQSVVWE